MTAPQIDFRPFLDFSAHYSTGLANVGVTDTGQLASASDVGMLFGWGVSGSHSWRYTNVGLDYRGTLDHYPTHSGYDSLGQSLLFGLHHRITRHITFSLSESAGFYSRNPGIVGLPQTVPFDPATTYVPITDYFDNRTLYLTTVASLTIQKTARLSFNFGGSLYQVRRRSTALYGSVGEGATADVQYRVGRRTTIGALYQFGHFGFNHIFGGSDYHGAAFSFARSLSPKVEFSGFAGVARVESKFIQSVPADPAIVALFGIAQITKVVHSIDYLPNVSARLSRTFPRGVAYLSGGHSVTPGNGLFLTSYATSISAGYDYTGVRRWSFSSGATYSRAKSIGNYLGTYGNVALTVSASRQLIHNVHFVAGYSANKYLSNDFHNYNRFIHSANIGLGWTPGDVPLRLW